MIAQDVCDMPLYLTPVIVVCEFVSFIVAGEMTSICQQTIDTAGAMRAVVLAGKRAHLLLWPSCLLLDEALLRDSQCVP